MDKIDRAALELREMDDLAAMRSPVHALHPLAKLITTVIYIIITASFDKYDLSGLSIMIVYPLLLLAGSGISPATCFYKMRVALPLVMAVGLFNPLFDRAALMTIGGITVSRGALSMVTLMLKGVCCLMASFVLAATTSMDAVCAALRKLRVAGTIVTLLLLTYRYIAVMVEELSVMMTAYRLRAPGQKGVHYTAWGSFLGQLLLRSMDRAGELYDAMQLRGFSGDFYYADVRKARAADYAFAILAPALLVLCRYVNIAEAVGRLMMGGGA